MSSPLRFLLTATALGAVTTLLPACGDSVTPGGGVQVADVVTDIVPLADADTVDAAQDVTALDASDGDTATTADAPTQDAAPDSTEDAAIDAVTDAGADAVDGAADDAAPDVAGPDALAVDAVDDAVDASALDAALPDTADDVPSDSGDDAVVAVDASDAADVADVSIAKCTSAADCAGSTPYCNAAATCVACLYNSQCPGDGAFCASNACTTPVNCVSDKDCTPLGAVCDNQAGVCRECLTALDCSTGQTCSANQCTALLPCQSSKECPGALVCALGKCVECGADTDCLNAQFCQQGLCTADVCTPESHCAFNSVATCKANGGGWDYTDCGLTAVCLSAACVPVVCSPNEVICKDGQVATCDASGTVQSIAPCPGNQTCVDTTCTDVICLANGTACDAQGNLTTCSSDGTQWLTSACPGGTACAAGICQPQICTPGATTCSGQKLLACTAFGLAWSVTATCTDFGDVCIKDACVPPVCVPATIKCENGNLQVCNGDAMGWSAMNCSDGDGCTVDSCDVGSAKCTHETLNCNDGNSCTIDSCNQTCQHTAVSGPVCDDGSACTTGETCVGGLCAAPVASLNVTTVAGSGATGSTNGAGSSASFGRPYALTRLPDGNMVASDYDTPRIRQINTDGTVSTLAGTGSSGSADGPAMSATFSTPTSIAADAAGNLFIADLGYHRIRLLSGGNVTTFAGSSIGWKDGVGTAAQFNSAQDIKFDANGVLWVADRGNHRIRRITADGAVTTAAGSGTQGYLDGAASAAQFNEPCRIAPASDGSVYIADCSNYRIRRLSADGLTVSTVAGSGIGYIDGAAGSAKFAWIGGLTWLGNTLIVSDNGNNRIRSVAGDGSVSTLAGSGSAAYVDGAPTSAAFNGQWNLAVDWNGALWIADGANQRIRKLVFASLSCNDANPCTTDSCGSKACVFTPVAPGSACSDGSACTSGDACGANGKCSGKAPPCTDNNPCTADFCNPATGACVFTPTEGPCNDNDICTNGDHCAAGTCQADTDTLISVAGSATAGYVDGAGKDARFNAPFGLAPTKAGGVYVADASGNRIRLVAADGTTTTVAGSGTAGYLDGAASTAQFSNPTRMVLDNQGAVIVADSQNHRIRKLSGTTVSTVAGSGTAGFQDGAATSAQFNNPFGLVYTSTGIIYVADSNNHRIRAIAADGTVSTLAGAGTVGNIDDTAAKATFNSPRGLCQANDGTLYVVDTLNHNIRRIVGNKVDTLAGSGLAGSADGVGTAATFYQPRECTVDPAGNLYVTDTYNNRLRRITPKGVVTTVAGSANGGGSTLTATDGNALSSVLAYPAVPAWTPGGNVWIADSNAVRKFVVANTDCNDGQACTTDACNPQTGACSGTAIANGGSCDDGLPCTVAEFCTAGSCGNGSANTCDDAQVCTTDSCDAAVGCKHAWQFAAPGCCKPNIWSTGFEGDSGNGVTLTSSASNGVWSIGTPAKVHAGTGGAAFTALSGNNNATINMPSITLPAGTTTLSFWLNFDAVSATCTGAFGNFACGSAQLQVYINGFNAFTQNVATGGWSQVVLNNNLGAGATPTATFVFTSQGNFLGGTAYSSAGTGVFIDDIQVTSSCQ